MASGMPNMPKKSFVKMKVTEGHVRSRSQNYLYALPRTPIHTSVTLLATVGTNKALKIKSARKTA